MVAVIVILPDVRKVGRVGRQRRSYKKQDRIEDEMSQASASISPPATQIAKPLTSSSASHLGNV